LKSGNAVIGLQHVKEKMHFWHFRVLPGTVINAVNFSSKAPFDI